jgi:hypothetical protein
MKWCAAVLDDQLTKWFSKLGHLIGTHPLYFLLIPPLLFLAFAKDLRDIVETTDIERLFSPSNGLGKEERAAIQEHFFEDPFLFYDPSRRTYGTRLGTVILTLKRGNQQSVDTLLSREVWADLRRTDQFIKNITVYHEGRPFK